MIRSTSSRIVAKGLNVLRATTVTERRYQGTVASEHSGEPDKQLFYTPEEGYWRTSPFEPVTVPNLTVDQYIWTNLKKWENKVATVCITTGREYTYAKLRDCSAALAIRLQSVFKLKPRDIIALCLPNLPEYPIAILGAIEAGLAVTTVNPIYTADEIARQLIASEAAFIIGTANIYKTLQQACALAKKNCPIVVICTNKNEQVPNGAIDFFELINTANVDYSALKKTDIRPDEMAFLPFSSGTTGLPKGVMLSHNNITVNCEQIQAKTPYESVILETTPTHQEVVPCILPFFHIYGLNVVMLSKLYLGIKLITMEQFKPENLIKSLVEYKGSSLNLVPPIILFLTHSPNITAKNATRLRTIMCGAAPIGHSDVERCLEKFPGVIFLQGYGMTETSPVTLMTPNGSKKYSSVGNLVSCTDAKIVTLDSTDGIGAGPNVTGELLVRGPEVMMGYLKNDEANEDIFRHSPSGGNKWLRTGDVGYYDEEGMFYITDRVKELIKVKGFQVPPAELEECLRNHPKVMEAAVIGIPHPQCGEVPKGIIVLKPGAQATEDEIKQYVAEKKAHYKRLEGGVIFVKEIPKNQTGKILRRELKEKFS